MIDMGGAMAWLALMLLAIVVIASAVGVTLYKLGVGK
jgi:hypothetical protein